MDSWFVPAFSAVAESEAILKQVIPYDQGFAEVNKYSGIFRFRFWFGRWIGKISLKLSPFMLPRPLYQIYIQTGKKFTHPISKALQ